MKTTSSPKGRKENGIIVGLIAVITLPILIVFVGVGIETIRAKYMRARLDQEATTICSSVAADAPFQARALERFRKILGDKVAEGKFEGVQLIEANFIYPTQPDSIPITGGDRYAREPYKDWRDATYGLKSCALGDASRAPTSTSGTVGPSINFIDIATDLSCSTFLHGGADCKYVWDPCDASTGLNRLGLWSQVEDSGTTFGCEFKARYDSFLTRALDSLPGGAALKPFGAGEYIISRVIWEVSPLPPFDYNTNNGSKKFNLPWSGSPLAPSNPDAGGAPLANLPYLPLTIAIAPELVTTQFDTMASPAPAASASDDDRFTLPDVAPTPSFSSGDYAEFRKRYDIQLAPHNGNAAFQSAQRDLELAGMDDGGIAFPTFNPPVSPPPTGVIQDIFDPTSSIDSSPPPTPTPVSGQSARGYVNAPALIPPASGGANATNKIWRDAAVACNNPLISARNILTSTLLETLGRLGTYRYTTELLVVNPRSIPADPLISSSPYTDFVRPSPPTTIMEMGEDPFDRRYQLPFVYFRNPNLFDPYGQVGWPYPWTGPEYNERWSQFHARITSQLRDCFHLYQMDWDVNNPASSAWISRYLYPLYFGGLDKTGAKFVNNDLGNFSFENPHWLFGTSPNIYANNSAATIDWTIYRRWSQAHPWDISSGTASTYLTAPEVVSILGSVQSCPIEGEGKYIDGGSTPQFCRKRENILRPDFVGLFLYLFPKEASQLGNLNTLLGQAGLTDYDLSKDGYSYQTPGMWAVANMPSVDSMPDPNSLQNPFEFDSSVDESLIELSGGANPSDARRMRRARNENSVVLIVTHKGPRSEDQAILHAILGCSKRKILVVYMPSGIYEPEINTYDSGTGTGTTLSDYQSHGQFSDISGYAGWSTSLMVSNAECADSDQINRLRSILWLSPLNPEFDNLKDTDGTTLANPYASMPGGEKYKAYWLDLLNDKQDTGSGRPYLFSGMLAQTIVRRLLTISGFRY